MNSIACPVDVACPNSFEAEKQIALPFRFCLFQLIGETLRSFSPQPRDRSPRPLARRPGSIGEKPGGMSGFAQTAGKALEIILCAANFRMSSPHQTNR
jgi:hypothetical protein